MEIDASLLADFPRASVHESGHALGLPHTRNFADIMFSFGYGGDVLDYFQRYRRLLKTWDDIPKHSGISDADRITIIGLTAARK